MKKRKAAAAAAAILAAVMMLSACGSQNSGTEYGSRHDRRRYIGRELLGRVGRRRRHTR